MSIVCVNVDPETNKNVAYKLCRKFIRVTSNPLSDHLPVGPNYKLDPCFLPAKFETIADRVFNLNVRLDDVWLVGFPKSGTTWTLSILWLLLNSLDYITDRSVELHQRAFVLEHSCLYEEMEEDSETTKNYVKRMDREIDKIDAAPSPRIIKSHLPIHLLPKDIWTVCPKLVYITRNPKDILVSGFHHYRNIYGYSGTWEQYFSNILEDNLMYMPIYSHVTNIWQLRHLENIFFFTYEDLSANTFCVVKQISEFLGHKYSDKQISDLCEHVTFKNMKENKFTNWEALLENFRDGFNLPETPNYRFLRKGLAAGYRSELSQEEIKQLDKMITNGLKYTDFKFADV